MTRAWGFLLGLSIVLLSSARARAESKADTPAPLVGAPEVLDYRYQLVLSDVVTLGLLVGAASQASNDAGRPLLIGSLATYALVPPMIHVANDQPLRGLGSFGLRVGAPVVGAGLGVALTAPVCASDNSGWGCLGAAVLFVGGGFIAGIAGGMIVDDAVLGRVELPRKQAAARRPGTFRAALVPLADPRRKSYGMSLTGTF